MITGAGSGIGKGLALALATRPYHSGDGSQATGCRRRGQKFRRQRRSRAGTGVSDHGGKGSEWRAC